MSTPQLVLRDLGLQPYLPVFERMQARADSRAADAPDEIWLLQHPPVFTQGRRGKPEHLLRASDIPLIQVDRGGQITYHGPGQLIAYLLLDLRRRQQGVRRIVTAMEQSVIAVLAGFGIEASARAEAPGVYVGGRKIASLGLRVKNGMSYHGLSFNLDMDLTPFGYINPCGYQGLEVTQLRDLVPQFDERDVKHALVRYLTEDLGYNVARYANQFDAEPEHIS